MAGQRFDLGDDVARVAVDAGRVEAGVGLDHWGPVHVVGAVEPDPPDVIRFAIGRYVANNRLGSVVAVTHARPGEGQPAVHVNVDVVVVLAVPRVVRWNAETPGHYVLEAEDDRRADVAAAVVGAGARLLSLRMEEPSLDDVYAHYFQEAAHAA